MMYKDDLRQENNNGHYSINGYYFKTRRKIRPSITTYNILPINNKEGFIEMISSSKTLYQLPKESFTIQNFINENNLIRLFENGRLAL